MKTICKLEKLTTVKVTVNSSDGIDFLTTLVLLNSKSITNLELKLLVQHFDLDFIGILTNLKTFNINIRIRTDEFVSKVKQTISKFRKLENLTLAEFPEEHLEDYLVEIKKLPLLRNFKLGPLFYRCYNDNRNVVKDNVLSQDIPFLTQFWGHSRNYELSYSTTIFQPYLTELLLNFKHLDIDLSVLTKNCPFVEYFRICILNNFQKKTNLLVNEQFLSQISKWTKLQILDLVNFNVSLNPENGTIIVFPRLTTLNIKYCDSTEALFRIIRTPELLNLTLQRSQSIEHELPHNRRMLDNLKTINTTHNHIPGSFPHANYIKMKIHFDQVIPFLKNLKSKSLNLDLKIYDRKTYLDT